MDQVFEVYDEDDRPVAEALLVATSPNGDWQAMTDAAGQFVANLAPGPYRVTASKNGVSGGPVDMTVGPCRITLGATPPTPNPPTTGDAFDLSAAIVASGDCPSVAGLPVLSSVSAIDLVDVGADGQGFTMNFPGRDTWPGVVPPGWEGPINWTLWIAEFIGGTWFVLPIKECLHDYCTVGPILNPGQIPQNLTYFAQSPMKGYQPRSGEQIGFFATTGDTRRMNLQPLGAGRTNVVLVPFTAGAYSW